MLEPAEQDILALHQSCDNTILLLFNKSMKHKENFNAFKEKR